jgi:hypothetical protein
LKNLLLPRMQTIILTIVFFWVGQGCGLFDAGSGVWINIPDQSVAFDLNTDIAKTKLQAWLTTNSYNIDISNLTELPDSITINEKFSIELVLQNIDLNNESALKSYIDSGKIRGVSIKYLTYNLTSTPNVDLPAVDFYIDAYGTTDIGTSSTKVGTLPSIKSGQLSNGEVVFAQGGREKMSEYFMGRRFTLIAKTDIIIDTTSGPATIPDGSLTGVLTIGVQFKVDPL